MIKNGLSRTKYRLWALCLAALSSMGFHPLYLSICQVNHNPRNQSLEIAAKVFTEDLILALEQEGVEGLHIGEAEEAEKADQYIGAYFQKQLGFKVNQQSVSYRYLGKEVELDVTWCYLEVLDVSEVSRIEVTNKLFMELFEPQRNIVHLRIGKQEKSIMLRKGQETQEVLFP